MGFRRKSFFTVSSFSSNLFHWECVFRSNTQYEINFNGNANRKQSDKTIKCLSMWAWGWAMHIEHGFAFYYMIPSAATVMCVREYRFVHLCMFCFCFFFLCSFLSSTCSRQINGFQRSSVIIRATSTEIPQTRKDVRAKKKLPMSYSKSYFVYDFEWRKKQHH